MLPQRKPLRLKGYDYNTMGAYFVTVCAADRKNLFGCVVGTGVLTRPQTEHGPTVQLTSYGTVVDKYIRQLHAFYEHISVDHYTIMPNHIHLLLSVSADGRVGRPGGRVGRPVPTAAAAKMSMVAQFVATLKRFSNKECGRQLWQARFHDHIIRDGADYERHANYILENPLRWELDELYIPY
ncbi:MAG: hypothetical protein E7549_03260 [Ruminococcaceae bacterium]|nr:hypothetical protein [Oscillospiraceae bacterium]